MLRSTRGHLGVKMRDRVVRRGSARRFRDTHGREDGHWDWWLSRVSVCYFSIVVVSLVA